MSIKFLVGFLERKHRLLKMEIPSQTFVLVTGGSGFLGSYCIIALLDQGYRVRATLRSLAKSSAVKDSLQKGGVAAPSLDRLSFVVADLNKDEGWKEAVSGCTFILHVASPFPAKLPRNENDLIIPARDGTLRVLRAAKAAGVKRVVMTSSFAAKLIPSYSSGEFAPNTIPPPQSQNMTDRFFPGLVGA